MVSRKDWDPTTPGPRRRTERFEQDDVIIPKDGTYPEDAVRVDEVRHNGAVHVFPLGGGFTGRLSVAKLRKWRKVHPQEIEGVTFRTGFFQMDWFGDQSFPGWTDGTVWNGWARPYFSFEVAQDLLRFQEQKVKEMGIDQAMEWHYDRRRDAFIIAGSPRTDPDDSDVAKATTIIVDGEEKIVYGIGTSSWTWDEVDE